MPYAKNHVPSYRKHRASGQAIVTLNGRDHYLGPHGTKASKFEYDRLIGEWLSNGRATCPLNSEAPVSITQLCVDYINHARLYYQKNGEPTTEFARAKLVIREFRKLYGQTMGSEFGPSRFKAFRDTYIARGLTRTTINGYMIHVIKAFRLAAENEKLDASIYHGLRAVERLKRGRTNAAEVQSIPPASIESIEAIKPLLSPIVADMIDLQRLTGMRPAEICGIRPMDIQRDDEIWFYRPESHKTEHHGKIRLIPIGPEGQKTLTKYLLRESSAHCFSPVDSIKKLNELKERETPENYGNRKGFRRNSKADLRKGKKPRKPGVRYTPDSYRRAVHRACEKAEVVKFSPNQIRKRAATDVRKVASLEAAQILLGHQSKTTTERFYAELNIDEAVKVISKIG